MSIAKPVAFSVGVVNVRTYKPSERQALIYVGRACRQWPGSPLGNPYRLPANHTEQQRLEAVESYARWLAEHLATRQGAEWAEFERIGSAIVYPGFSPKASVVLGCWCAPKLCHAHVLQYELMRWLGEPWCEHIEATVWAKHLAQHAEALVPELGEPVQMGFSLALVG